MLNLAWISATPVAQTGYGRETREIGYRLVDLGFKVTFIGAFGDVVIWGGKEELTTFKGNKAVVLPLTSPSSAADVIDAYAMKYGFDVVIGFMDCFGLEFLNNVKCPVIGYIPIDGPFTEEMKNFMRNYHKVVAYSKFGFNELLKFYPPTKTGYIPHAIDTEVFKPLNKKEYDEAREWMAATPDLAGPVPKDASFVAVNTSANIGPRKCLPLLMRTWKRFSEMHKEDPPHLVIWTNSYAPGKGYNLVSLRSKLGLEKYIHFPKYDPILEPTSDENFRRIYGASDVYVGNSVAEGFGLPTVEAMGCGLPPIAPANSAQTEYIVGNGWLVDNIDPEDYIEYPVYVPTMQTYPVPSQKSLLKKLEEAYSNPDLRKKYGRRSRNFVVKNYSWSVVLPKWVELLNGLEEELELFKKINEVMSTPVG